MTNNQSDPIEKYTITIDPETWKILIKWSEEECRSTSGQVKYLVRKYKSELTKKPRKRLKKLVSPRSPSRIISVLEDTKDESGWEYRPIKQAKFHHKTTQRSDLIELIIQYVEPITNTELTELSGVEYRLVCKQTSGMYGQGLLKRKRIPSKNRKDRWQYIVRSQAIKMLQSRETIKMLEQYNQKKSEVAILA